MHPNISQISMLPGTKQVDLQPDIKQEPSTVDFGQLLSDAIENVNHTQVVSNKQTEALVKGNNVENLHDVMISAKKASITLQAAVEIQSKMIDAYNKIMRMQI